VAANYFNRWKSSHAKYLEGWQERKAYLISQLGGEGIFAAVEQHLLEIHRFASFSDRVSDGTLSGKSTKMDYVRAISDVVSDAHTYPLFDEDTAFLISSEMREKRDDILHTKLNRSKEVGLAADLLARLPLFERATVREILDIRRELERPLRSFRAAMTKFSNQIQSAAWDRDFAQDADQVFRSEVAPAVLALEDEEKSNSFLNKLTAKVADKSLQVGSAVTASGAISALAVRMLNLPLADVAALAVGPAIVAGGVAYSAYKEWKEKQKEIEGNTLFFYYKAGSLLENRSFEYDDTGKSCDQSLVLTA